jgi:hypothetical protein
VLLQAELKEGCRQAGLAISGTKAKLLARLQQNGVANSYGASDAGGSSNKKQKTEEDQSVSTHLAACCCLHLALKIHCIAALYRSSELILYSTTLSPCW